MGAGDKQDVPQLELTSFSKLCCLLELSVQRCEHGACECEWGAARRGKVKGPFGFLAICGRHFRVLRTRQLEHQSNLTEVPGSTAILLALRAFWVLPNAR